MDIHIKDTLNIKVNGMERIVRSGTIGVEKNKIVYFFDTTRTHAVGFPRDLCVNNPALFSVTRTISDREIPISDVLSILEGIEDKSIRDYLEEQIRAL